MTDEQLLTDFLNHRDGSAFERLVLRYGPMVLRVCRDVLDRQADADAEDAFQATFMVFFRQAGSIRDRTSIGRWLAEVAWRISRRERRRASKIRTQERQAPSMDPVAAPDQDPADREARPILLDEIHRLPAKLRDPILLCYFEGLTVEETARKLTIPLGTIKSRLTRARELLRSRLIRRGVAASILLLLLFRLTEESPAAVPSTLVASTVEASIGSQGVSRRVALMVAAEEAGRLSSFSTTFWTFLAVLILVLGGVQLTSAGFAEASPTGLIRNLIQGANFWGPAKGHCQTHVTRIR